MDISRVKRSEWIGFAGSIVLAVALFLPWFSTSCDAKLKPAGCDFESLINHQRGTFNAFQTYTILEWVLLAACLAPFVLAWIIARGHEISWRPGEVTMIVGMLALALILLNGIILGRPGTSSQAPGVPAHSVAISIDIGYWIGLDRVLPDRLRRLRQTGGVEPGEEASGRHVGESPEATPGGEAAGDRGRPCCPGVIERKRRQAIPLGSPGRGRGAEASEAGSQPGDGARASDRVRRDGGGTLGRPR